MASKFSQELREQAILLLVETDNISQTALKLGVDKSTVCRWNKKYAEQIAKIRNEMLEKKAKEFLKKANYLGMRNTLDIQEAIAKKIKLGQINDAVELMSKSNAYNKTSSDAVRLDNSMPTEKVSIDGSIKTFEDEFKDDNL